MFSFEAAFIKKEVCKKFTAVFDLEVLEKEENKDNKSNSYPWFKLLFTLFLKDLFEQFNLHLLLLPFEH